MNESNTKYLDTFAAWLRNLGDDAEQLGDLVAIQDLPETARQLIVGALNYLFRSLDLIPDGIDDIGYLDDAFVLRVAAELASREDTSALEPEKLRSLNRLADDREIVLGFLEADFDRLESYVKGLRRGAVRGRSVQDIISDDPTRDAFLSDLQAFCKSYESPSFGREEKNLIKLRAFFDAKLPK